MPIPNRFSTVNSILTCPYLKLRNETLTDYIFSRKSHAIKKIIIKNKNAFFEFCKTGPYTQFVFKYTPKYVATYDVLQINNQDLTLTKATYYLAIERNGHVSCRLDYEGQDKYKHSKSSGMPIKSREKRSLD